MADLWFPDFRDELNETRYPFGDNATLTTTDGTQQLDLTTFVDASLYPVGAQGRLYLSEIDVSPSAVTLTLSDETGTVRGSSTFDPLLPPDNLVFTDSTGRPAGVIISDALRLAAFSAWDSRPHTFALGATEFAASVVVPTPEGGVEGLLSPLQELFTGDVWLVGDQGVVVRQDTDGSVRIDVVGDPLYVRRLCVPIDLFEPPLMVQTINGCPPDQYGNWNLTVGQALAADTIVRIYPTEGGLKIEATGPLLQG